MVISNAEGEWTPPVKGPITRDLKFAGIAIVIYAAIVGIHYWLGYSVIALLN